MRNYIPTINISSLLKSDFDNQSAKNTIKKIEKACSDVGFFQIVGHGIKKEKINSICKIGNKFFNSSNENKNKLAPKKWNKKNKNIYPIDPPKTTKKILNTRSILEKNVDKKYILLKILN